MSEHVRDEMESLHVGGRARGCGVATCAGRDRKVKVSDLKNFKGAIVREVEWWRFGRY